MRTTDEVTSTLSKDLAMDLRREENEIEESKITPRILARVTVLCGVSGEQFRSQVQCWTYGALDPSESAK